MSDIFAVRNVDERTKQFIYDYAHENSKSIGEALTDIVFLVKVHIREQQKHGLKKRKKSIFTVYNKIAFKSNDPNLSKNIDNVLYGKRD
ncbi:MAG: hypothetical protein AABX38_01745 [Candidatus Micrarchaeota archaeon]